MPNRKLEMLFARHGEAVDITRYSQVGTDDYGDPEFAATTVTARALVERYGQQSAYLRTPIGEIPNVDVLVFVRDTVPVNTVDDDTPKASRIERGTGEVYRVKTTFHEAPGVIECGCEQLAQSTSLP